MSSTIVIRLLGVRKNRNGSQQLKQLTAMIVKIDIFNDLTLESFNGQSEIMNCLLSHGSNFNSFNLIQFRINDDDDNVSSVIHYF
ncbi:12609_t:CDS:2 [Acaulospora colombiana]|uniref:12609_t:CDS:1 n=1 Tax=Acaulospora colombiana TaxID=27376 RepID=A0ACA9KGP5_9GLOM|nr:12609_t:CDS:2 [Acaulospora colombiana]